MSKEARQRCTRVLESSSGTGLNPMADAVVEGTSIPDSENPIFHVQPLRGTGAGW